MLNPSIFILSLYINNAILFYYAFPELKSFILKNQNSINAPLIDKYYLIIIWALVFLFVIIDNIIYLKKIIKTMNLIKRKK